MVLALERRLRSVFGSMGSACFASGFTEGKRGRGNQNRECQGAVRGTQGFLTALPARRDRGTDHARPDAKEVRSGG